MMIDRMCHPNDPTIVNNNNNNNNNNSNTNDVVPNDHDDDNNDNNVLLLRECLYAVQGISDGKYIQFYNTNDTTTNNTTVATSPSKSLEGVLYTIPSSPSIATSSWMELPNSDAIMICSTLGIYVRSIQRYILMMMMTHNNVTNDRSHKYHHHHHNNNNSSSIIRSFCIALQNEIQNYLYYISNITMNQNTYESSYSSSKQIIYVSSIQELIYKINPYMIPFKTITMILSMIYNNTSSSNDDHDGTTTTMGIYIITHLYRHLLHYNPYHNHHSQRTTSNNTNNNNITPTINTRSIISNLFHASIQPWLLMVYHWTMDGIIIRNSNNTNHNHNNDFFININTNCNDQYLWQNKYTIVWDLIPPIGIFINDMNNQYDNYDVVVNPNSTISSFGMNHTTSCTTSSRYNHRIIQWILIIGKGVNYIRQCLHDTSWSLLRELILVQHNNNDNNNYNIDIDHVNEEINQCTIDDENTFLNSKNNDDRQRIMNSMNQFGFTYESVVSKVKHTTKLYSTLELSARLVHEHILYYLHHEFHFVQHLYAMKQFLLFGQGDFYITFIDSINTEYPTSTISNKRNKSNIIGIYRHTLSNIVDASIKSTNAYINFPVHILDCLDIDLLLDKDDDANYMFAIPKDDTNTNNNNSMKQIDHRTVWDIFVLKYTVPDPMVAIVHDDAMSIYQSIFLFLFRFNYIEYRLHTSYRQSSMIQRTLQRNAQYLAINITTNTSYQQAIQLLRTISITRNSMIHFITTFKRYIMVDVIECKWSQLLNSIDSAQTLDDVIVSHDKYLNNIVRQCFISTTGTLHIQNNIHDIISDHIRTIFQTILEYCTIQEELFDETLIIANRAIQKRKTAQELMKQGSWGFHHEREAIEQDTCFGLSNQTKLVPFQQLSEQYTKQIQELIHIFDQTVNCHPIRTNINPINNTTTPSKISTSNRTSLLEDTNRGSIHDIPYDIDLDSLRYFAAQLNHNGYYGVTNL